MTENAPIVFERPVRIRFAHCDPAGIVFFPQYLVLTMRMSRSCKAMWRRFCRLIAATAFSR
jgi:acyl-CoA thioesterase FadM